MSLFDELLRLIRLTDPEEKCSGTQALFQSYSRESYKAESSPAVPVPIPGLPRDLKLVSPRELPKRGIQTVQGRTVLFHAIAHIEFNAISLALDAAYRFRDMPEDFYYDWISVAADEARHFQMITDYLHQHGCVYGDYPAHNGLWDMAVKTEHDVLARMALVPRVMEARGLDVTPSMIQKLNSAGDPEGVSILETIYNEEIGHVKIGSRWYRWICSERNLDPDSTFFALVEMHHHGELRGPFNIEARTESGFSRHELSRLENK